MQGQNNGHTLDFFTQLAASTKDPNTGVSSIESLDVHAKHADYDMFAEFFCASLLPKLAKFFPQLRKLKLGQVSYETAGTWRFGPEYWLPECAGVFKK